MIKYVLAEIDPLGGIMVNEQIGMVTQASLRALKQMANAQLPVLDGVNPYHISLNGPLSSSCAAIPADWNATSYQWAVGENVLLEAASPDATEEIIVKASGIIIFRS